MDWFTIEESAERLQTFLSGFHAAQYVYVGVESGVFEAVVEPLEPEVVADRLDLDASAVRRFCEIGGRWGLIEPVGLMDDARIRNAEEFRLTEAFVPYLGGEDLTRDMGDLFRMRVGFLGEEFHEQPSALEGRSWASFHDRSADYSATLASATRGLQQVFIYKLIPEDLQKLDLKLSAGRRVLDIGCGAGRLCCSIAEKYDGVEVVGIDLDADALSLARKKAIEDGLEDRITFQELDAANLNELSGSFDVALSFLSLHQIPPDDRSDVFSGLDDILAESAVMGILDTVFPESVAEFNENPYRNGVETQWVELAWGNVIPTATDQRELLANAGLYETARTAFAGRFVAIEASRDSEASLSQLE